MMTMSKTLITSREAKGLEIANFFDVVLNEAGLDQERGQRLIENGGEFQEGLKDLIKRFSVTNQFANEEVASGYGYLSGYKPKSVARQVKILNGLFPNLGSANKRLFGKPLPENAEGLFAIPRWECFSTTYNEAVVRVLDQIKLICGGKFYNYRENQLGPKFLRQHAKTVKAFSMLGEQQTGYEILVVACQFGLRHRGRSVRRAREVMNSLEFGLGAFANGCMILTHPERLQYYDDLWIDCAGDEFSDGGVGSFGHAPCFRFYGGKVLFDSRPLGAAFGNCGSSSGLLSQ